MIMIQREKKMIREILLAAKQKKQLYKNKLVCGCVYRSFSDLQAGIFFRFTINGGKLGQQNKSQMIPIQKQKSGLTLQKITQVINTFKNLEILIKQNSSYTHQLDPQFIKNLQQFIKSPTILPHVVLDRKPLPYQPQPFQFLEILFEDSLPKKCKINGLNNYATHLTRQQFMYITSDISYKIRILIDGIINSRQADNTKNIETIIMLNLLDSDQYYQRNQKLNPILEDLHKIKLVQFAGMYNQYFRISKYLQHFTFKTTKQRQINTKLNCKIIIQTNFKVFAVIESHNLRQNKVINRILSMLLKSQKQGAEYQELFIGEIEQQFMKRQIFNKTQIKANQYFDFFKQYIDEAIAQPKDLGKWKKLRYIGLEGPSEQSNIPNNIKQQVKLWQHLKNQSKFSEIREDKYLRNY